MKRKNREVGFVNEPRTDKGTSWLPEVGKVQKRDAQCYGNTKHTEPPAHKMYSKTRISKAACQHREAIGNWQSGGKEGGLAQRKSPGGPKRQRRQEEENR